MNKSYCFVGVLILVFFISTHQLEASELVVYPNSAVEFILGPQSKNPSSLNLWPWYDTNAIEKGLQHASEFPIEAPGTIPASGTVTVANSSNIVVGQGTKFLTEIKPGSIVWIPDHNNAKQIYYVSSIQDDLKLTLTSNYSDGVGGGSGKSVYPINDINAYNEFYEGRNYYDLAKVQWINYYRTGNVTFRDSARRIADTWWNAPFIDQGRRSGNNLIAPRNVSLEGLMLRALDGHPEMWPWITDYVRDAYNTWIGWRLNNNGLWYGVRESGYTLLFMSELAVVHPDPIIREEFRLKVIDATSKYFIRLQKADGSWRWGDDSYWPGKEAEQAFHVGILLEGMIKSHMLDNYGVTIQSTLRDSIKNSILKSVDEIYRSQYRYDYISDMPGVRWRNIIYATIWDPVTGLVVERWGPTQTLNNSNYSNPADVVRESRQANSLVIHAFGYAYHLTGDTKYKTQGDEIFDATYGKSDGLYGFADARSREYDQAYRSGGQYLVWRIGSTTPQTSPTDLIAPSTPSSFSATAVSSSQINLSWNVATDNVGVVGYKIYRSGFLIANSINNTYSDIGLNPATAYAYTVSAYDANNNESLQTAPVTTTTLQSSIPTLSIGSRVKTTAKLKVRITPTTNGKAFCTQPLGILGTILGGPQVANGYKWWQINYDVNCDGWSVENYLIPVTVGVTNPYLPLSVGSYGKEVSTLQNILKNLGYFTYEVTGYFGEITRSAVKDFQKANALDAVGIVGPKTRAILEKLGW